MPPDSEVDRSELSPARRRMRQRTHEGASPGPAPIWPVVYTPTSLHDVISQVADDLIVQTGKLALPVIVSGIIGAIPKPTSGGMHFSVPLTEPESRDKIISLDIRHSLIEKAGVEEGDAVTVVGKLIARLWNGRVDFRVDVGAFDMAEQVTDRDAKKADVAAVAMLKRIGRTGRSFPSRLPFRISLIHSRSTHAQVDRDFIGGLAGAAKSVEVKSIPISMTNAASVARAMAEADGDVIAVVRGGGDAVQFEIFDHEDVLIAIGEAKAFCLLGLGHSTNDTLADLLADHSANTPSAAGVFIRDEVAKLAKLQVALDAAAAARAEAARASAAQPSEVDPARQHPLVSDEDALRSKIIWFIVGAVVAVFLAKLLG